MILVDVTNIHSACSASATITGYGYIELMVLHLNPFYSFGNDSMSCPLCEVRKVSLILLLVMSSWQDKLWFDKQ